jgi:hypothetical protein
LYLALFAISPLLSFFLTREIRDFAIARGWVAAASGDRPLLLDVNVLASVFPVALADALDRVLTPALSIYDPVPEYVAAAHAS